MNAQEKGLQLIATIRNELDAGTIHYSSKTEEVLETPLAILDALTRNELLLVFTCQRCGEIVEEIKTIEERYCDGCM